MMISVSTALCSSAMPDFGDLHAAAALEMERLGDDADGQDAHFARGSGDNRRRAGAGAAAHAGGDEDHVRAGEVVADLLERLFGGGLADLRLGARAEPLRHLEAHLDDALGARGGQRLRVGVGDDEVDAGEAGDDHVVDRVAAGAADAADHDARLQFPQFGSLQIDRHILPHSVGRPPTPIRLPNAYLQGLPPTKAPNSFRNSPSTSARRAPHTRLPRAPAA